MSDLPLTVLSLKQGEEGVVYMLSGGKNFTSRLAGMGIVAGVRIKVLRKSGGSVIVLASATRVALGTGQAEKILVMRAADIGEDTSSLKQKKTLLVALAGQPNVGKTTVFNVLTGLSQHVGNWPGKTVEKKEGIHVTDAVDMKIVDLPGTYSLSALSEEERVAREFIINERPDVVVHVVDGSTMERGLYLLSELLLLSAPIILVVNMIDVAQNQGIHVNIEALQESLGMPVVSMVASRNRGIRELVAEIIELAEGRLPFEPRLPDVSDDHREIFQNLTELVKEYVPPLYTEVWVATKLMEGDPGVMTIMEDLMPPHKWGSVQELLIKHEDALRAVVGGRYDWIEEVTRAAISRFKRGQVLITDRIDHILTRPSVGIPVLLGILAFVFLITYAVGFPLQKVLELAVASFGRWLDGALSFSPGWVRGFVIDGIIGGAGSVLTFIPILAIFFAAITFLENVGYMARAAFVMDRFMHIVGLHGKSFLPMCLGFGCNVPSVLGARIIESKRARLLTIFLAPFVPCTGRLAALTFVTAAVFGEKAMMVSWALVSLNIIALGAVGIVVGRVFSRSEPVPFIMELPLYHRPDLRTIGIVVWNRIMAFVKKAGTVILVFSAALWVVAHIPSGNIENSLLGWAGHILEPLGRPMGLDWKMIVALLSSIIAKENAVATLGVLYNVGDHGLRAVLPGVISHASALAFLVVLMIFIPCLPTIAVMRQEMESRKWFLLSLIVMLCISFVGSILAYHLALAIGL
jgi:ferrous iron transport protein B